MQNNFSLPPKQQNLPNQRWLIYPEQPEITKGLAKTLEISPLIAQTLINRDISTIEQAQAFLDPESIKLPLPIQEFPDLDISLNLLQATISQQQKIAICGDYDADGMTSTALLLRALKHLGAKVDYAIPSRMQEGYGINQRIVEEFHQEGVSLILTVDNGIAAYEPIARARELGVNVIITDHHDIPPQLPPAHAILNPKLISETSPYRGVAGVGVAYILAVSLAQRLGKHQGLIKPLLELFTLGTIADLAPLTGVNRRLVKRGLQYLPHSQLAGVQALIQVSGVKAREEGRGKKEEGRGKREEGTYQEGRGKKEEGREKREEGTQTPINFQHPIDGGVLNTKSKDNQKSLKPDDIGFRLGPRINAVGRIADPQIVIELLTTDDMGIALERAMQCEEINQQRQLLCEEIEQEAIAWCESSQINLQEERVLVVVQPGWHHGVIGIVASRLVERYGVPVFIGTYEEEGEEIIRGSARGIPEFHVFEALQFCDELLGKYGGHRAAGGFSFSAENLDKFRSCLSEFAHQCLEIQHLKPLISIDAEAEIKELNFDLYRQIDLLHPCGIENKDPVFWSRNVKISEQRIVGKGHIKLTLIEGEIIQAIAWRWGDYFPLPSVVDIAYKMRENTWNGQSNIELELLGVRLPMEVSRNSQTSPQNFPQKVEFYYNNRPYTCSLYQMGDVKELRIRNSRGEVLAIQQGQKIGLLGKTRNNAKQVNVTDARFFNLVKAAMSALKL
ncbi:MAG: single-stranded-DNA-specific exonuclease RecJ [Okeania sp. SIO2C9]|uniref:single-stranded-DNA-specific exonuclease RecJ n=1 Tax=Okeania sp. SIO2C9 TaxID=2607791 RepID=UPI0013BF30EC|nr:DHH family phosphoesterase [Okeania sp. SIO2C9]NEQ75166.1 single-stranded-DNA-specific exonuclease RecJ [Okeania sp. SIO2C9]